MHQIISLGQCTEDSFICRLLFSYEVLSPAALTFFVSYAEGAVESLWSIDQYFEFILVLMLSTGLAFQVAHHLCSPPLELYYSNIAACMRAQCYNLYEC